MDFHVIFEIRINFESDLTNLTLKKSFIGVHFSHVFRNMPEVLVANIAFVARFDVLLHV